MEHGFAPDDSVVTVIASTGEHLVTDQTSRTASQLAGSFRLAMEGMHHPRGHGVGDVPLVLSPAPVHPPRRHGRPQAYVAAPPQAVPPPGVVCRGASPALRRSWGGPSSRDR